MTHKCAGYRYLANKNSSSKEVHDKENENKNCQLNEIEDWECFHSLSTAHANGYDNCHWCIGNSKR